MDERALAQKLKRHSRSALDRAIQRYTPYEIGRASCRERV